MIKVMLFTFAPRSRARGDVINDDSSAKVGNALAVRTRGIKINVSA